MESGVIITKSQKTLIAMGCVVIFGIFIIGIILTLDIIYNSQPTGHQLTVTHTAPKGYPSPNKTHQSFGNITQIGDVAYEVDEGNSHWSAQRTLISASFYVTYYNTLKRPLTVPIKDSLDIGCIAANNQSFKQHPTIFTGQDTSESHVINLPSWGETVITFTVNGSCQYVGTRDGDHWWSMPSLGID